MDKSIIENPDVQRLIKQAVLDGFKIKELKAENKALRGEEPIPYAWWAECPALAQRTMERIIDKNDELKAENEKLKERIEEIEKIINYAIDGIDALANYWPDGEMRKDIHAVKETLEQALERKS